MARKVSFLVDTTGPVRVPLDEIPADVKKFVEDTYTHQRKTPGRTRVEYDTVKELEEDFKLMADYAAQRPAGILKIRKSPTRELKDIEMDIRITAAVVENGNRNAGNDRRQPAGQTRLSTNGPGQWPGPLPRKATQMASQKHQELEAMAVDIRLDIASLENAISVLEKHSPDGIAGYRAVTVVEMGLLVSTLRTQLFNLEMEMVAAQ